ncbi:MAG: C1 family peptidase [Candidatus Thiodiazotropha sp.]
MFKFYLKLQQENKCHFKKKLEKAEVSGFVDVPKSEVKLQEAVATQGPVSVAIDASHRSFQSYRSGKEDHFLS